MVVTETTAQRVYAELDPQPRAAGERRRETVDELEQPTGQRAGQRCRTRLLDAARGIFGRELYNVTECDSGHAAVFNVDGLIDDRVQPLAGQPPQMGQDVVDAPKAVEELATLGILWLEAA